MNAENIVDVAMLVQLNKPQKRALLLRDQLRCLDPTHLDTFLHGLTTDEPPTYRTINGTVYPPFEQVTIKEDATRFDLGNVIFPEDTCRAYMTVEDERFEIRTEDALPKDDAELGSVAIHRFVAQNMFPLFKAKYKTIHARMEKINEARRVAYNMLDHPPAKFEEGDTLAKLHSASSTAEEDPSQAHGNTRKRKEIARHITNKRQRIGLETIPETMKTETFNTIPSQVKVDLFDNIVKTAFPNFDNLLVASWNVVSVYANVGSDFPELHRAVVELKGALEGFEGAYSPRLKSNAKGRKEAIPGQQNQSRTSTPVPRFVISTPVPASRSSPTPAVQTGEDNATAQRFQDDSDDLQHQMLPPRTPQIHQQHPEEDVKHVDHQPEPHPSTSNDHTALHQSAPPEHHPADPDPNSNLSSPVEQHPPPPHELAHKNRSRSASSRGSPAIPGSELLRKRQEYASSITKANRSSTGAALGQQYPQQGEYGEESEHAQDQHAQDKPVTTQDPRRPQGNFGNSVLGVKKAGAAPAAPMMMHGRKEGGGGGKSDGGGRRG